MTGEPLRGESRFVPVGNGASLHLRQFQAPEAPGRAPPALLVHGAIENGRVFYSRSGRGLAPWLAQRGYTVYVLDLRGRGGSRPAVTRHARWDQTDAIVEDIPAATDYIARLHPDEHQVWIAHSWGGVLMSGVLARRADLRRHVACSVYFGSKRHVSVWNPHRVIYIDVIWTALCSALRRVYGYVPARRFGLGSDNESAGSHRQSVAWVRSPEWVDPRDGFDYAEALRDGGLPPTLYLAGAGDPALGHPEDVQRFIAECGPHEQSYVVLSRRDGFPRDYGHIDMLTHFTAPDAIYPRVISWLERNRPGND